MTAREITSVVLVLIGAALLVAGAAVALGLAGALAAGGTVTLVAGILLGLGETRPPT